MKNEERSLGFPEDFHWVFPLRCGRIVTRRETVLRWESGQLLLSISCGKGSVRLTEQEREYAAGCVIAAEQAGCITIRPAEETEYRYLILCNAEELLCCITGREGIWPGPKNSRCTYLLEKICDAALDQRYPDIYTASAQVFELLMELNAQCARAQTAYSLLIRQAIDLIQQEYAFLTGVDGLADLLGVSKNHLIRRFTEETGQSPGRFLQNTRIENAKLLLQNREYSMEIIANMVGYSNANYFCKVFRRETGESPGAYRMQHLAPPKLDEDTRRQMERLEELYLI